MNPEQVIADFLASSFDDDQFVRLRAAAVARRIVYAICSKCLVSYSAVGFHGLNGQEDWGEPPASIAYRDLSYVFDDRERQRKLIPIIDAEIARRASLRDEARAKAVETCSVDSTMLERAEIGR